MTLKIEIKKDDVFDVAPKEMISGHVYVNSLGNIYICNRVVGTSIIAFSVCGKFFISSEWENVSILREVNAKLIVTSR